MAVKMKEVASSNIKAIGYDSEKKRLFVEFKNGGKWRYDSVPAATFTEFAQSKSIGSFFHQNIRSMFKASQVGEEESDGA
jgi:hypothetical protein